MWARFKRWLIALLTEDTPSSPEIMDADLAALRDIAYSAPAEGWFIWECREYQKYPAFWFDPYRYHGSKLAYPDPTQEEIAAVFGLSAIKARDAYGERALAKMLNATDLGLPSQYDPDSDYARSPDPVEYAMKKYHALN